LKVLEKSLNLILTNGQEPWLLQLSLILLLLISLVSNSDVAIVWSPSIFCLSVCLENPVKAIGWNEMLLAKTIV